MEVVHCDNGPQWKRYTLTPVHSGRVHFDTCPQRKWCTLIPVHNGMIHIDTGAQWTWYTLTQIRSGSDTLRHWSTVEVVHFSTGPQWDCAWWDWTWSEWITDTHRDLRVTLSIACCKLWIPTMRVSRGVWRKASLLRLVVKVVGP